MMNDEVIKELWDAKDSIAKEYNYNIDELTKYFLSKQSTRSNLFFRAVKADVPNKSSKRTATASAEFGRSSSQRDPCD